jgi:cytochrome c556
MRFGKSFTLAGIAIAGWVGLAGAQDIIADRQNEMKEFGKSMGTFKAVLIDKSGGSLADVAAGAKEIAGDAGAIPDWFPEGTGEGKTDAMPTIWEKPDEFAADARLLGELANKLASAAEAGDATAATATFAAMGKDGCGGCHADFRKPKEQSYKQQ